MQNQNCKFKLKLGTYTNSNMENSTIENGEFTFSANTLFGQTHFFDTFDSKMWYLD